jgi:glycosyltransferase involved in cell wall biosynthesis
LIGSILKLLLRIPLLFDYQGSLSGESLNHEFFSSTSMLMKLFKWLEVFIDHRADLIITSSDKGRQELVDDWGIAPEKVIKLIDGVDTDIFRPYSRIDARRELGIPEDVKLVVFLGIFNKYQGVDLLLDVISLVKAKAPDIRFLLMGFPDEEYQKKAAEMGIDDIITFTGRVSYDRAPFFLSAGDIAVSPKLAKTEANGKLFNYMSCGLPTVVFDNEINREILGDTGVYVEYGNASKLADSIISTLNDSEYLASLSKRVRARAVQEHSWSARSSLLLTVYKMLLTRR